MTAGHGCEGVCQLGCTAKGRERLSSRPVAARLESVAQEGDRFFRPCAFSPSSGTLPPGRRAMHRAPDGQPCAPRGNPALSPALAGAACAAMSFIGPTPRLLVRDTLPSSMGCRRRPAPGVSAKAARKIRRAKPRSPASIGQGSSPGRAFRRLWAARCTQRQPTEGTGMQPD